MRSPSSKQRLGSQGFGLVYILLLIMVLSVVGFSFWRLHTGTSKPNTKTAITSQGTRTKSAPTIDKPADQWIEYRNDQARILFKHPASWQVSTDAPRYADDGSLGEVSGKVTSPSGAELTWQYAVWGGGGGECEPGENDVPFADGNKCGSKQIYSADYLPGPSLATNQVIRTQHFVFSKSKFRAQGSGLPSTYQLCLDTYYPDGQDLYAIGTTMGFLMPCGFFKTGFGATFPVASQADFSSPEAQTAEQIMRTFDTF